MSVEISTGLRDMLERIRRKQEADAERFKGLDGDLCQLCHAYGEDKRSLWIDCGYDVAEVVPEMMDTRCFEDPDAAKRGHYLRFCKSCRGRLLSAMKEWRRECIALRGTPKDHDGHVEDDDPERNIPVRVNGAIVMLTHEEWDEREARRDGAD